MPEQNARQHQPHPWALACKNWPEVKLLPFGINLHFGPNSLIMRLSRRPRPSRRVKFKVDDNVQAFITGPSLDHFTGCLVYNIFRDADDSVPAFSLRLAHATRRKKGLVHDGYYCGVCHYTLYVEAGKDCRVRQVTDIEAIYQVQLMVSSVETTSEGSRYLDSNNYCLDSVNYGWLEEQARLVNTQ